MTAEKDNNNKRYWLRVNKTRNNAGPLKSIGNPGSGLFSFDTDIALVTAFVNFTAPE